MTNWSPPRATISPGPQFDESSACALCYTSGTTGKPKGVLYTHRSTLLHALWRLAARRHRDAAPRCRLPGRADVPRLRLERALCRADERRQAGLPGPQLDGASLYELFEAEGVTLEPRRADGLARLRELSARQQRKRARRCAASLSGGAAVPPALIEAFEATRHHVIQGWGMTEMSPLGTVATLKAQASRRSTCRATRDQARNRAGRCSASR